MSERASAPGSSGDAPNDEPEVLDDAGEAALMREVLREQEQHREGGVEPGLDAALDAAHERAQHEASRLSGRGPAVVLLSPACASWDHWKSYEHRGDAFRGMARALPGAESVGRAA